MADTAKEFLFRKGVTDDPSKTLIVSRDGEEFDIAALMEEWSESVRSDAVWDSQWPPDTKSVPAVDIGEIKPRTMTLDVIHDLKDGTYVISTNGTWRPGSYRGLEAAKLAFSFDDKVLYELQGSVNPGSNITLEMLQGHGKLKPIGLHLPR